MATSEAFEGLTPAQIPHADIRKCRSCGRMRGQVRQSPSLHNSEMNRHGKYAWWGVCRPCYDLRMLRVKRNAKCFYLTAQFSQFLDGKRINARVADEATKDD